MAPHLILKKYFTRKKKANPQYSLRAFALALKVNVAFVSRVFSGKQEIPLKRLKHMADILDMDAIALKDLKKAIAQDYLISLGLSGKDLTTAAKPVLQNFEDKAPTEKEISVLNPWYNITIMEMTTCADFKNDVGDIAKRLNLTKAQVQDSLDYLIHNGYLKLQDNELIKTNKLVRLPTKKSIHIVRQFHKQMFELALKEMFQNTNDASFSKRLITSTSIAVNSENIPKAKERLAEMQLEIAEILRDGPCDQIYDLSLVLFPLTK